MYLLEPFFNRFGILRLLVPRRHDTAVIVYTLNSLTLVPRTKQGLWVAPQPLVGLWVAPTFLHATTRPKQLFIDATVIDTTNTHYTR